MEKIYWIIIDGQRNGPMSYEELGASCLLTPETPVWREGMADWANASQLPELAPLLARFNQWAPQPQYGPGQPMYGVPQPEYAVPQQGQQPVAAKAPSNYLVWAILATICCCIPTGIVAIYYASKVNPAFRSGDYAGADAASEKAGIWCIVSLVAGLIWTPFSMLYSIMTL